MGNKNYLESLRESALQSRDKLIITILCNVAEETLECENYDGDSIISEFLTAEQLDTMLSGFRMAGFETNAYTDEDTFMRDILNDDFYRSQGKHNIVFNSAQKGTSIGRKSLIPAFCDLHHICHSNNNAYIVSLCRDKFFSGSLVESLGFPCPTSWLYKGNLGWLSGRRPDLGSKVIAKLNYETSSIGLSDQNIFTYTPNMDKFIHDLCQKYRQDIVVQVFIPGYEVEVPVIIDKECFAVAPMGIYYHDFAPLGTTILDYEGRKNHMYHFADFHQVSKSAADEIAQCAVKVAAALGICGLGRIDFRVMERDYAPYITDIATNPGIHMNTSIFHAFEDMGYNYQDMMTILVGLTLSRYELI